jgi:hypothetical protein
MAQVNKVHPGVSCSTFSFSVDMLEAHATAAPRRPY